MAATCFVGQLFLLSLGPLSLDCCLLLVEKTDLLILGREKTSERVEARGSNNNTKEEVESREEERGRNNLPVASSCHLVVSSPQRSDVADAQTHHGAFAPLTSTLPLYP